jgi:hypothetical protein
MGSRRGCAAAVAASVLVSACAQHQTRDALRTNEGLPVRPEAEAEAGVLRVGTALGDWSDSSPALVTYAANAAEGWARQRLTHEPSADWRDDVTIAAGLHLLAFETDGAGGFIRWSHVDNPRLVIIRHRGSAGHNFGDGRTPDGTLEPEWAAFLERHPNVMVVSVRWRDSGIPGPNSGRFTRRDNTPTNLAEMAHRRPVRVFRWIVENLVDVSTPIALLGHSAGSDAILSTLDAQEPWLGRVRYFAPSSPGQNYDLAASCNEQTPPGTYIDPRTGARGKSGAAANIRRSTYAHLPDYLQLLAPACAVGRMTEELATPSNFRDRLPTIGALHPEAVIRFAVGDQNDVDTNDGFTWTSGQLFNHPYFASYRKEWFWTDEVPHQGLWRAGTEALASHIASIEAALLK